MSLLFVHFIASLYILTTLVPVKCYTYQTKPLFLSLSELASLEASAQGLINRPNSHFGDPVGILTTAKHSEVKLFKVKCHKDSIEVVITPHLFRTRHAVDGLQVRLGPVSTAQERCTAKVSAKGEYIIRVLLTECGSTVMLTESAVIYNNLLLYTPSLPGDPFQVVGTAIPVQCEYKRRYTVSSGALKPTWSPVIAVQSAHLNLDFRLRLMTSGLVSDDWTSERESSVYFLGEMVNIEASVDHTLPLQLYVNSCVATLAPDVNSYPRYPFIDHQGCFTDSQLSGSSSRFLPRVQDKLLQIQLEPFLFHQDHRNTIYINCHLEAVPTSKKDPLKKACSFISGRWRSVDGDNRVCESCDSTGDTAQSCSAKSNHKRARRETELHGKTALGPVIFLPRKAYVRGNLKTSAFSPSPPSTCQHPCQREHLRGGQMEGKNDLPEDLLR